MAEVDKEQVMSKEKTHLNKGIRHLIEGCGDIPNADLMADVLETQMKELIALAIERAKPEKKITVIEDEIPANLGQGKFGEMIKRNIRNPELSEEECLEAYGYNKAIEDYHNNLKRELGL